MPGSSSERLRCAIVFGGLTLFLLVSVAAAYYLWRYGPTIFTLEHQNRSSAGAANPARAQVGRELYLSNCAQCHGQSAEGDPGWKATRPDGSYPPPPHDGAGHTWHHSDRLLIRIIKEGGAAVYGSQGFQSQMPAFGDALGDEEIAAILDYFRSLWGSDQREFQAQVSRQDTGG